MQQCCTIIPKGTQCSRRVLDAVRCKQHEEIYQITGPNQTRKNELKYIHDLNMVKISNQYYDNTRRTEADRIKKVNDERVENIRYLSALHSLELKIQEETTARGGVNADEEFIQRHRERQVRRFEQRRQNILRRREAWENAARLQGRPQGANLHGQVQNAAVNQLQNPDLGQIANDKQNVHTTVVVNTVKETVKKILEIQVPIEYRTETMKTMTEIIETCKPSLRATWQMTSKYCNQQEDIYDLGPGIFSRLLNAIWQFIKASEHSDDLRKILSSELEDSVGMCAQGNLSRICNTLNGYMEGLDLRSRTEILGEKLSRLMEIVNIIERVQNARTILADMKIPETEWETWIDPLKED
jgi:hypothetical protein